MAFAFFLAFLAVLWLIGLPLYWLFYSTPPERKGVFEKLTWYRQQPLWPQGILKVAFIVMNAWVLFPLRGALVAVIVIGVFLMLPQQ